MSDTELVIKIPEEIIEYIKTNDCLSVIYSSEVAEAIKKGTSLPEGHGELIDIGECNRELFYQQCGGANSLITTKTAFDMLLSLPTSIKADKAESEG